MGDVDVSYGEILIIDTYDTNAANIELANIAQSVSAYATGSPGSVLYSPLIGISAETFYFSNNVFIKNDLTISGSLFFNSLVVSGDSIFQSNLNIVKDCSINSNLYVDKVTTLEEQVNINGPLLTSGTVTFQGDHTHTIEDSIEVGNLPGAAPGVAIGPTPRADAQILLDSSYGNIFATGYLQVNETTSIGKLGSLVNDCRIAHIDHSTDNYAFQQSLLGITSINAVDGRYITFDISQNEKIRIDSSGNTHFNSSDPGYVAIDISATSGIKLPKGTTSERPEGNPDISGIIRYNTETQQFEGYATAWQGLGGVIDVNQDTKIMAEDYPTADNNELRFYTKNIERMKVDASGTIQMMIYDENYIALDISATTGIMLPKGNTAQRPVAGGRDTSIREDISGVIRYNTETQQFEGYATAWQGLGGVIDVDQNTKILAEDYPTADNNELKFFTAGTPRMIIKSDGKVDISENVHLDKRLDVSGATVLDSTLNVTGDAVFGGQIHGPSTFYIDPSVVGDDTGLVIVKGNLQVDGTTTTINSTTVDISDLTIKLAANSINTASSDGAGIEIQHGGSILYKDPDNVWEFNRGVSITSGTLEVTESIDCFSSGTFADTLTCSKVGTGLSVTSDAVIGGNVGIGTTAPGEKLDVAGNISVSGQIAVNKDTNEISWIGKAALGHVGHSDSAGFAHIDKATSVNYALLQTDTGDTYLNSQSGKRVYIRNNNDVTTQACFYNGKLGLGNLTSPSYTLDVNGNVNCAGNLTLPDGDVQTQIDSKQATLTFGKSSGNALKSEEALSTNNVLLMGASHVKGRNYTELKSDLTLNNVENTAVSTWAGSSNINTLGTITTGTWQGTAIADTYISSASTWNDKQDALTASSSVAINTLLAESATIRPMSTSASYALDVEGDVNCTGAFLIDGVEVVGPQGPQGAQGAQGPQGPQGAQGAQGAAGSSASVVWTTSGSDVYRSGGYVGIGTTGPTAPLHVQTSVTFSSAVGGSIPMRVYIHESHSAGDWTRYSTTGSTYNGAQGSPGTANTVSARLEGAITLKAIYHQSDERIKYDIVDISDDQALITLRNLKPKKYRYKHWLDDSSENVYGFIAQEVEEVLPNSVTKQSAYIPNIMDVAKVSHNQYETESESESCILTFKTDITDISVNDYICCCDSSLNYIREVEIIEIIDSKTIKINKAFTTTQMTFTTDAGDTATNIIIVEGKLVDDFHVLEKNRIWTVATAALQEVDRQLQAEKSKVETLENQVLTLNSELAAIKTHLGL